MPDGPGLEQNQRTCMFPVRLTEVERAALDERAAQTGYSRAALIRHALFSSPMPRSIPRPTIEHQEVARLLGELGRIGGNINQLARHANAGRFQSNSIELALRELLTLRAACLKALGCHNE